jgi:hypothetical protein
MALLCGVPNPQSPDKSIPPLSGVDFRKQFNTDAKIIAVIRSGSVIGRAPIVGMPGRDHPERTAPRACRVVEDAQVGNDKASRVAPAAPPLIADQRFRLSGELLDARGNQPSSRPQGLALSPVVQIQRFSS